MKPTRNLASRFLMILIPFFLILCQACGIEVGNPTEPTPIQPKDSIATPVTPDSINADQSAIVQLATSQHDEAVLALTERYDDRSLASALALSLNREKLPLPPGTFDLVDPLTAKQSDDEDKDESPADDIIGKCEKGKNASSLVVNNQVKAANKKNSRKNTKYDVTENYTREFTATLSGGNAGISCGAKGAVIDWRKIDSITINSQSQRLRDRTLVLSDGTVVSANSLSATSSQKSEIPAASFANGIVSFDKKVSFQSEQKITDVEAKASSLTTRVETKNDLIVRQKLTLATGALSQTTIVSGSVSSTLSSGMKVVLNYEMLELGNSDNCTPAQGTLSGEIFRSANTSIPSSTFQLVFSSEGASIVFSDGLTAAVELESCNLNPAVKPNLN